MTTQPISTPPARVPVQPGSPAEVTVTDTGLHLRNLTVTEPDVTGAAAAAVARGEDLHHWVRTVLRVGAGAVTAAGAGAELTRVERAVEALTEQVTCAVSGAVRSLDDSVSRATDPSTGAIAEASQAAVTRLATGVQRLVVGEEAVLPAQVRASVAQVCDAALAEIHRAVAANSEAVRQAVARDRTATQTAVLEAVRDQYRHLNETVRELRASVVQQAAATQVANAAEKAGAGKGRTYEHQVAEAVASIAAGAGDGGAAHVGDTGGIHNRKGDVVVELVSVPGKPSPRLVVEAKLKGSGSKLSVTAWRAELSTARASRDAVVACGVTLPELMPTPGDRLLVLDRHSFLVGWSPGEPLQLLTAAYLLLRVTAAGDGAGTATLPVNVIQQRLDDLAEGLRPLADIHKALQQTRGPLDRIEAVANQLRDDLAQRISQLRSDLGARQ